MKILGVNFSHNCSFAYIENNILKEYYEEDRFNKEKNVLGMMPHPERMIDTSLSGEDGSLFFKNLIKKVTTKKKS
jgi:hypothetical protein